MAAPDTYIIGFAAVVLFLAQHVLKNFYLHGYLHIGVTAREGSRSYLRVTNRSWFAASEASLLLTISDMTEEDIRDFGEVKKTAYISNSNALMVEDSYLPWSYAYAKNPNPPIMTLASKQTLCAAFINLHDSPTDSEKLIEIASENYFYDPLAITQETKSMVFLAWRKYKGTIKFVSKDSFTKSVDFEIDPDDPEFPIRVW